MTLTVCVEETNSEQDGSTAKSTHRRRAIHRRIWAPFVLQTVAPSGLELTGTTSGPPATIEVQAGNMRTANAAKETGDTHFSISLSGAADLAAADSLFCSEVRGGRISGTTYLFRRSKRARSGRPFPRLKTRSRRQPNSGPPGFRTGLRNHCQTTPNAVRVNVRNGCCRRLPDRAGLAMDLHRLGVHHGT